MLRHILTLARVSNLPTVWSNCLAAWLISGAVPSPAILPLLIGASLLYAGGCTLNDAFDAGWDAQHRPERLIPSGMLGAGTVWAIGLTEITTGVLTIIAGGVTNVWAPLALAAAILLYDAWHKQSPLSVIAMGACRWLLYLTAAASAGGSIREAMLCGAVLWLYIIVLSLVARGEAKRSAAMPASRYLLLLLPAALGALAWMHGARGWDAAVPALAAIGGFALLLPKRPASVSVWVNRLLAGIPLIDLSLFLIVWKSHTAIHPAWAIVFPCAIAASLLFQRWFRAT